jgi:hypothetical protein
MDESPFAASPTGQRRRVLHIILLCAVVQGWGLYGLSAAAEQDAWPSTTPGLMMALYALITVMPLTIQFLAEHYLRRLTWVLAGAIGLVFAGFGWHFGQMVANEPGKGFFEAKDSAEHVIVGLILWLLAMPFVQSRLVTNNWWPNYPTYFSHAWRNLLTVAEAALFTGLLWMLLFLWSTLFHAIGIDFFRELFKADVFVIPVTWLTFGVALHLMTGMERLASVLLQQLLNVLKWLALLAVLILGLFSIALAFKLPELFGTGKRVIAAEHLLWLTAVVVLLFNAAYREGETDQPYPRAIGLVLRCLFPFTLIIVLTAVWSLYLRTSEYGLTVSRVWGWLVAAVAVAFAIGYTHAAARKGRWMQGMDRVNLVVVLGVIAVLVATLTPLLSPYRLTAESQFQRAVAAAGKHEETEGSWREDSYRTLRFSAGTYGMTKLGSLANLQEVPGAADIRNRAKIVMAPGFNRYDSQVDYNKLLADLKVYPAGRTLSPDLIAVAASAVKTKNYFRLFEKDSETSGVFIDLDSDGTEEFVLMTRSNALIFQADGAQWSVGGEMNAAGKCAQQKIAPELEAGRFSARPPRWADLVIGKRLYNATTSDSCVEPRLRTLEPAQ